jgi:hypothetical protein
MFPELELPHAASASAQAAATMIGREWRRIERVRVATP